jgi:phosphodiesterase/alkaline phosphatase D-like protein
MKFLTLAVALLLTICVGAAQAAPQTPASSQAAAAADVTRGPAVEYVSDHDAVIAWTSKNPVDMQARFGTAVNNLTQTADAVENSRDPNHRVKLNNLQPDTIYYYQMTSAGQPVGAVNSFKTVPKGAPPNRTYVDQTAQTPASSQTAATMADVTRGPAVEYVSDHDAVVAWTSKNPVDMQARFGTAVNNLTQTADAVENSHGTNHRVKLNNLQPNTIYYYQMTVAGQPVGAVNSLKTVPKGAPPNRTYVDQSPK